MQFLHSNILLETGIKIQSYCSPSRFIQEKEEKEDWENVYKDL